MDFDDSINMRLSNPSESSNRQAAQQYIQLFKQASEKNEDKKSGYFQIDSSPKEPRVEEGSSGKKDKDSGKSTGGFDKTFKPVPNYGLSDSITKYVEKR